MPHRARATFDGLLVVLFGATTAWPVCAWCWRGEPDRRVMPEERPIAPLPRWPADAAQWTLFPRAFEAWFQDRLGGRDERLRFWNRIHVEGFGVSPTPRIELGPATWVFLNDGDALAAARGLRPLDPNDLAAWRTAIEARAAWCREREIEYVFALVPEKPDLYLDRAPPGHARLGPTRLDQMAAAFGPRAPAAWLDLRPELARERERDRADDHAYYPLGSHWTDRGACAAYEAILGRLAAWRPALAPRPRSHWHWADSRALGDSWAARLYLTGRLFQNEQHALDLPEPEVVLKEASGAIGDHVVYETADASRPRLLMLHDSYGEPLRRFLPGHFSRSAFEWGRDFQPPAIEAERPDVVLEVWAARVLERRPALTLPAQAAAIERAYEHSSQVLYTLDAARDARYLASRGGVRVTPVEEGLAIAFDQDGAGILLPEFGAARECVLRLDLSVAVDAGLTVHYLTDSDPEFSRTRALGFGLHAGRNTVFVALSIPDRRGPLFVRFGTRGQASTLHAAEARASD